MKLAFNLRKKKSIRYLLIYKEKIVEVFCCHTYLFYLFKKFLTDNKDFCSASLITDRWLLTAAHCIFGKENNPRRIKVFLGCHRRQVCQGERSADLLIPHPFYMTSQVINNTEIVKAILN